MPIKLRDWQVRFTSRNRRPYLFGYTEDLEQWISTSPLKSANGKLITTSSGSVYELISSVEDPLAPIVPLFKPL